MKMKRFYFSLLEVLIALGLTLLILSSLLAAYLGIERSTAYWQTQEKEQFRERFISHRLTDIFNHLVPVDQNKTFFFTSEPGAGWTLPGALSLTFTYDNGPSLDHALSGKVLGRLFIDLEGNLTLLTWPSRDAWPEGGIGSFHREVLMKDVVKWDLAFFHLSGPKEETKVAAWKEGAYPKEIKRLPGAIKMGITTKDEKMHLFTFPIPKVLSVIQERA